VEDRTGRPQADIESASAHELFDIIDSEFGSEELLDLDRE
jgi:hypothetical protein